MPSKFIPPKTREGRIRGLGNAKAAPVTQEIRTLCKELHTLDKDIDVSKAELTKLNGEKELINDKLLALLQKSGLDSVKIDALGTFYIHESLRPTIANEVALFKDLRARKMGSLIQEKVNPKTLAATVKELEDGGEKPLKGVDIFRDPSVRMRKA